MTRIPPVAVPERMVRGRIPGRRHREGVRLRPQKARVQARRPAEGARAQRIR